MFAVLNMDFVRMLSIIRATLIIHVLILLQVALPHRSVEKVVRMAATNLHALRLLVRHRTSVLDTGSRGTPTIRAIHCP